MRHFDVVDGKYVRVTEIRSKLFKSARDWFEKNDFTEISVPHITGATGSCEWFPNAMTVEMFDANGNQTEMFLRQTGQLYLEAFTLAHNRVFTIGPSFRQEKKVTDRHLCEFTLIEFEGRDFELDGLMDKIESLLHSMFRTAHTIMPNDILKRFFTMSFNRITYQESVDLLNKNGFTVEYGDDFGAPEEKAICRILDGLPTFITHYPSDPKPKQGGVIKFFSMKRDNGITLCCDLILPEAGESVGGAVREGNAALCKKQFEESYMYDHLIERNVDPKQFEWYFEVLQHGTGQSSGCGIGFERVVQSILATEMADVSIKTAIELPRSPDYLVP